uniref:Uncharacterized protein n=1 Tax=Alexandrium monilatum TaxID=311494 RepID=A0A7S4Q4P5_9DINO
MADWESKAQALGLDEMCVQALSNVPSERAHQILNDLKSKTATTEIRNPSAFVSKACHESWDDKETLRRALEIDMWSTLLDDTAKEELQAVDPSCALSVLADVRQLGERVRNPSSYVCGTLRKRISEGKLMSAAGLGGGDASGYSAPHVPMMRNPVMMMGRSAPQAFSSQGDYYPDPSASSNWRMDNRTQEAPIHRWYGKPRQASEQTKLEIDALVAELAPDLDERAIGRVYHLGSTAEARKALESLAEAGDVRNKSAFINGIVAKRLSKMDSEPQQMTEEEQAAEADRTFEFESQLELIHSDLDDQAKVMLKEVQSKLGAAAGIQLLKELQAKKESGDIRNVSGFAMTMARTRLSGAQGSNQMYQHQGQMRQENSAEFEQALSKWTEELDERAVKMLQELAKQMGSAVAMNVLKELEVKVDKEEVRNISSFVFSMARQRLTQGTMDSNYTPSPAMLKNPFAVFPTVQSLKTGNSTQQPNPMMAQMMRTQFMPMPTAQMMMAQMMMANFAAPMAFAQAAQAKQMQQQKPRVHVPPGAATRSGTASLPWIQETLESYGLKGRLDEIVLERMLSAEPARILEILQDMTNRDQPVRNPSAFIQKSLKDYPEAGKRSAWNALGDSGDWGHQSKYARTDRDWFQDSYSSDDPFMKYSHLVSRMDEAAVNRLKGHHDQSRVRDILAEMAAKANDIRNPSAFVMRALNDPKQGGSLGPLY